MKLHLEGTTKINADKEQAFNMMTDTKFLSKSIPDAEEVKVIDDSTIEARLRLRLALVSTSLKIKMMIEKIQPPSRAALMIDGSGSGSTVKIRSELQLEGDKPTSIKWSADAEIYGLIAGIGSSILQGFAEKKVSEIFDKITKSIEQGSSAT